MKTIDRNASQVDVVQAVNELIDRHDQLVKKMEMLDYSVLDLNNVIIDLLRQLGYEQETVKMDS